MQKKPNKRSLYKRDCNYEFENEIVAKNRRAALCCKCHCEVSSLLTAHFDIHWEREKNLYERQDPYKYLC